MASFNERFDNWVRWCNAKGLMQRRTGSLEGNYRSPQCWDPPGPRPAVIDLPDAILLNRAYTWMAVHAPREAKVIKIMTFFGHWRATWKAAKLGVHHTKLDDAYKTARTMMKNATEHAERKRISKVVESMTVTVQAVPPPSVEVESSPEFSRVFCSAAT